MRLEDREAVLMKKHEEMESLNRQASVNVTVHTRCVCVCVCCELFCVSCLFSFFPFLLSPSSFYTSVHSLSSLLPAI